MPLLYFNDLAGLAGLPQDKALHEPHPECRRQRARHAELCRQFRHVGTGLRAPIRGSASSRSISSIRPRTRAMSCQRSAQARAELAAPGGLRRRLRRCGPRLCLLCAGARRSGEPVAICAISATRAGRRMEHRHRRRADRRRRRRSRRPFAAPPMASSARAKLRSRPIPPPTAMTITARFVRDLAGTTALAIEGGEPSIVPALMQRTSDARYAPQRHDDAGKGLDAARGL